MSLYEAILALRESDPARKHVEYYLDLCHKMAIVCLEQKVRCGRLNLTRLQARIDDLAWDFLADLFIVDENNKLAKIANFYAPILQNLNGDPGTEKLLLAQTRRLVFQKVNDGLHRLFRDNDPELAKMIRNLKDIIKDWDKLPQLEIKERLRRNMVYIKGANRSYSQMPLMPPEILEARLVPRIRGQMSDKQLLEICIDIIAQQNDYEKCYPLTELAQVICRARARAGYPIERQETPDNAILEIEKALDWPKLIGLSVKSVNSDMRPSYLDKRKLDKCTYDIFFEVIKEILIAQYVDGVQKNFFTTLAFRIPGLTNDEYVAKYRTTFEYFMKRCRKELQDNVKKYL